MEFDKDFTILTVSDNCASLDILGSILAPYYDIKKAGSTGEAANLLKDEDINLIILDIAIHNNDYHEFLKDIKSNEETMRIPVVLIGDSSRPEHEEKSFALGAVDYISKPFMASIIKARVNNQRMIVNQIRAIEELGMLDPLTDIANRRGFDNRIKQEWLRAARDKTCISLAIADIDHFKDFNDKYGHVQGDVLLSMLAKQLVSMMRRPADFVARWGGEEFVMMFPNTELKGIIKYLETIRESVQKMVIPDLPSTTISIGVAAIVPTLEKSMEDFFSQADKALYEAKNTGRNKVCSYNT
ncbi:MAG: diguanylate cyclase [Fibromonadaceae bacterium]|jgi:diguanylate cyclase (GGDEF)-like protein|nr:diguanylate cyclase [Fibromonadaceae bacterium]